MLRLKSTAAALAIVAMLGGCAGQVPGGGPAPDIGAIAQQVIGDVKAACGVAPLISTVIGLINAGAANIVSIICGVVNNPPRSARMLRRGNSPVVDYGTVIVNGRSVDILVTRQGL